MPENSFDAYFERVLPLAAAIAMLKTFLAEEIGMKARTKIQGSYGRRLTKDERKAIQMATDAAIATLNPDLLKIDATWAPKSAEEVKQKLIELKLNVDFKEWLTDAVTRIYKEPQASLPDYK